MKYACFLLLALSPLVQSEIYEEGDELCRDFVNLARMEPTSAALGSCKEAIAWSDFRVAFTNRYGSKSWHRHELYPPRSETVYDEIRRSGIDLFSRDIRGMVQLVKLLRENEDLAPGISKIQINGGLVLDYSADGWQIVSEYDSVNRRMQEGLEEEFDDMVALRPLRARLYKMLQQGKDPKAIMYEYHRATLELDATNDTAKK